LCTGVADDPYVDQWVEYTEYKIDYARNQQQKNYHPDDVSGNVPEQFVHIPMKPR
jgi:hypothetical protein